MRARGRQALIALKLASFAFLLPVTAGTSAQTVVPAGISHPATVPAQRVGTSGLDNYLQYQQDPVSSAPGPLPRASGKLASISPRAGAN